MLVGDFDLLYIIDMVTQDISVTSIKFDKETNI